MGRIASGGIPPLGTEPVVAVMFLPFSLFGAIVAAVNGGGAVWPIARNRAPPMMAPQARPCVERRQEPWTVGVHVVPL